MHWRFQSREDEILVNVARINPCLWAAFTFWTVLSCFRFNSSKINSHPRDKNKLRISVEKVQVRNDQTEFSTFPPRKRADVEMRQAGRGNLKSTLQRNRSTHFLQWQSDRTRQRKNIWPQWQSKPQSPDLIVHCTGLAPVWPHCSVGKAKKSGGWGIRFPPRLKISFFALCGLPCPH